MQFQQQYLSAGFSADQRQDANDLANSIMMLCKASPLPAFAICGLFQGIAYIIMRDLEDQVDATQAAPTSTQAPPATSRSPAPHVQQ